MDEIGIVLSGGGTQSCVCQLLADAERGIVREGQLVLIDRGASTVRILARVDAIHPFNDFFTEGDPWSEARRKNVAIPSTVARQYEVAELELLRELGGMDVSYPPRPGDRVVPIDPARDYSLVFDTKGDEGIVKLGSLSGYSQLPIPLQVENIPMHMGVFGVTGSGKSFTTGVLLEKLLQIPAGPQLQVSYPMLIIDANGDYTNYSSSTKKLPANWRASWVRRFVFPRALGSARSSEDEDLFPIGISLDALAPREVAELILLYYKGGPTDLSELQISALEQLIETFREDHRIPTDSVFTHPEHFRRFLAALTELPTDVLAPSAKSAAIRAVRTVRRRLDSEYNLISKDSPLTQVDFVDRITAERGVAILDFSADGAPGVDLPTKQLVISYLASKLLTRFTEFKIASDQRYLLFLIEEAQNFAPSPSYPIGSHLAKVKLMAIATQGRKFGLSLCLVSQRPSFVDPVVLSMCNSFLIHRLSPEDTDYVRRASGGLPSSIASRLTSLRRGEFVLTGQMATVPFALVGSVAPAERTIPHAAGTTNVIADLSRSMT
jgi:DNA helicase HerA-like ATPase